MAKQLNKHRIRVTQMGVVLVFVLSIFTRPMPAMGEGSWAHGVLEMLGLVFVMVCALGRLYCTAFLGGHKNAKLVTYGPFSVTRNPLYFFSFVGVCGLVMISGHLAFIALIPAVFLWVYFDVIRREEAFLLERFGQDYAQYMATTPRFWPDFRRFHAPETVPMCPRFMLYALRDSTLWLAILPFFELIEKLQEEGLIPVLAVLP